jgi:hypothetical protein
MLAETLAMFRLQGVEKSAVEAAFMFLLFGLRPYTTTESSHDKITRAATILTAQKAIGIFMRGRWADLTPAFFSRLRTKSTPFMIPTIYAEHLKPPKLLHKKPAISFAYQHISIKHA